MLINAQQMIDRGACWPEGKLRDYYGDGKTPLEVLHDDTISVDDRFWTLLHDSIIPERELHLLACDFAESVLHIYEAKHPDGTRPRDAIKAKRLWVDDKISDSELTAARDAISDALHTARDAISDAWDAARDAAWVDARDSAWGAVWAAVSNASLTTRATEQEKQIAMVHGVLIKLENAQSAESEND